MSLYGFSMLSLLARLVNKNIRQRGCRIFLMSKLYLERIASVAF